VTTDPDKVQKGMKHVRKLIDIYVGERSWHIVEMLRAQLVQFRDKGDPHASEAVNQALRELYDVEIAYIDAQVSEPRPRAADPTFIIFDELHHLDYPREMPPIPNIREIDPDQNPFYSREPRVRDWENRKFKPNRQRRRK
jgi:hypothetical protein